MLQPANEAHCGHYHQNLEAHFWRILREVTNSCLLLFMPQVPAFQEASYESFTTSEWVMYFTGDRGTAFFPWNSENIFLFLRWKFLRLKSRVLKKAVALWIVFLLRTKWLLYWIISEPLLTAVGQRMTKTSNTWANGIDMKYTQNKKQLIVPI